MRKERRFGVPVDSDTHVFNVLSPVSFQCATLTEGMSISGNSFSNFSISSSPVTFTSVVLGGESKSSKEKPPLEKVWPAGGADGTGISSSSEMSGKAEAAASKSMSSPPAAVANVPPVGVENSSPSSSLSRERKSVIVGGGGTASSESGRRRRRVTGGHQCVPKGKP